MNKNKGLISFNTNFSGNEQNIANMLGINDKDSQSNKDEKARCQMCQYYMKEIQEVNIKVKNSFIRQKNYKNLIYCLQTQNNHVLQSTDNVVQDFQSYILKIQQSLRQRDEIISRLSQDIEHINLVSDNLSQIVSQQKLKIQQIQELHKQQVQVLQNAIKDLKDHIFRQVSEKANIQRKQRQDNRKNQSQKYILQQQIQCLRQQIAEKQQLVKFFSSSNNQLRIQLIQLKSKAEVEDLTIATQRKKGILNESVQVNLQIKKQNQELRLINRKLQSQSNSLIQQTQRIQMAYIDAKLEIDILKSQVEKLSHSRSRSLQNQVGCIYRNFVRKPIKNLKFERKPTFGVIKLNKQQNSNEVSTNCVINQEQESQII